MTREEITRELKEEIKCIEKVLEDYSRDTERKPLERRIEALEEAVKAVNNSGWMPCSKRLPEEEGFYLVTQKDKVGTLITTDVAFYTVLYGWEEYDPRYEITAWMPRPEPYGKEQSCEQIDIELKAGQSGYDVVGEYIRRYWKYNIPDTTIVSIGISYNGNAYEMHNEIADPCGVNDIEFLYDWWEGERFIKIFGIQSVRELDISGGIYTKG